MIRPFTCLCLLMAAGSGLYVYSAKHQAQLLDRDIAKLVRTAQDSRSQAQMLHAEYDLLGDPDRLRDLSSQVLTLQSTAPTQFTTLAELDKRLPPVAPLPVLQPDPTTTPEPAAAGVPVASVPAPAIPAAPVTVEKPAEKPPERIAEKPPERPIILARPQPRPPAVMASAAEPAAPPVSPSSPLLRRTPSTLAMASAEPLRPLPPSALRPTPLQRVAPPAAIRRPRQEAELPASATLPTPLSSDPYARISRTASTEPTLRPMPVVASALGMARTMMTPPSQLGGMQAQPIPAATLPQVRR